MPLIPIHVHVGNEMNHRLSADTANEDAFFAEPPDKFRTRYVGPANVRHNNVRLHRREIDTDAR
jgi:hypothetical protein